MLSFIKKIFNKKKLSENLLWITDFSNEQSRQFFTEIGDGYKTYFDKGLCLTLERKDLYAWTVNNVNQFQNMVLEGVIDFSEINTLVPDITGETQSEAGYCAYGFLFRYVNDLNFYSLLISDKGFFRFDVVFNGNQIPLIGWTPIPKEIQDNKNNDNSIPVKVIANDTKFSIIINNQLAIIIDDDTIQSSGSIAFAAQNWHQYEKVTGCLKFISIEARDIYIDAASRQWNHHSEEQHLLNAESYSAVGRYVPAILEIKDLWKTQKPSIETILFASRLYLAEQLYDEAEILFNKALELAPTSTDIQENYASFLYLKNNLEKLKKYLQELPTLHKRPLLCSLLGHVYASELNWENALTFYSEAFSLEPRQPLHKINEAICYESLNDNFNAFLSRYESAEILLDQKNFTEFENQIAILEKYNLDDKTSLAKINFIKAKFNYILNNYEKAQQLLEEYINNYSEIDSSKDAETNYLLSKIYQNNLDIQKAVSFAEKAVKIDETKSEYLRQYAEILYSINKIDEAEAITKKACSINAQDGYLWNLATSIALRQNDFNQAEASVLTALSVLPDNLSVLKNYLVVMNHLNRFDEALPVLDAAASHSGYGSSYRSQALHLTANFLRDKERYEEAEVRYRKALLLTPKNSLLLSDFASLCISTEKLNEADSLLTTAYSAEPLAYTCQLLACIAVKKGDQSRAEVILRQSIEDAEEKNQNCADLMFDLANLYLQTNRIEQAEEICNLLKEKKYLEQYEQFSQIINEKTKDRISCGLCGRNWFVPHNITNVGSLHLTAQPPDDMPAGNCPNCGKIYCIGCAKDYLDENGRFRCPKCDAYLKIQDKGVAWLLKTWRNDESN